MANTKWNKKKDQRRCELIDKEEDEIALPEELRELDKLQAELLEHKKDPLFVKKQKLSKKKKKLNNLC